MGVIYSFIDFGRTVENLGKTRFMARGESAGAAGGLLAAAGGVPSGSPARYPAAVGARFLGNLAARIRPVAAGGA